MAYMEVLLNEDIDNLGHRGQVVRVRAGYGRNFLLPQKLAIEATPGNKRMIEEHRRVLAKRENKERATAEKHGELISGIELVFERKVGEHGLLYGSVTTLDIAEALAERGYTIERRRIQLRDPIKEVGEYDVAVKLHREVSPTVKVVVRKEGAGAEAKATAEAAVTAEAAAPATTESEPPEETEEAAE